jgi:hypothetical protein
LDKDFIGESFYPQELEKLKNVSEKYVEKV